tara:strand:+ start:118 stop:342 length:225 start_codon:yes stop_codon:yes gene_type:complete
MLNLEQKLQIINATIPTVMYYEDLELISDDSLRDILRLKRIVQDCVSTVKSEGTSWIPELDYYANELHNAIMNK